MPRRRLPDAERRSHKLYFRARPAEYAGLTAISQALKVPPSRILRRLLREAITGGPDYFTDDVKELRMMHVHLAAVGRNLNQLVRAANRGEPLLNADVLRVVDVLRLQVAGIEAHYLNAVRAAAWRSWAPLYREAGLPWPFDQDEAATDRPTRQPGRGPARAERQDTGEPTV